MIKRLDHKDRKQAANILVLQGKSYRAESRIIKAHLPSTSRSLDHIMKDSSTFFGYFDKDKLIGVLAYKREEDKLKITHLFVDPERQREKVASHLYAHLIDGETSAQRILVEVASKNFPALKFYQEYGFTELESYQREGVELKLLERLTSAWELDKPRDYTPFIAVAIGILLFLLGRRSARHF